MTATDREPCPIHKPGPCSEDCPNSPEAHVQAALAGRLAAERAEALAPIVALIEDAEARGIAKKVGWVQTTALRAAAGPAAVHQHDRTIAAQALRDAADWFGDDGMWQAHEVGIVLRGRADTLDKEEA